MSIRLLGPPTIRRDGQVQRLAGRKTWGLLAYLVLQSPAPRRPELAERLWPEADDPMGALRWHLLQVRRAIEPLSISESDGGLHLDHAGATIDVLAVLAGDLEAARAEDLCRGELLEGLPFDDVPSFEGWLSIQRARVATAVGDVLRWAATTQARSDPDLALRLVDRALLRDPFDDGLHELAVEVHVIRGDRAAAEAHVARAAKLYADELGIDAPETIARPIRRPPSPKGAPLVSLDVSARTLMELARARLDAADFEAALDAARRAASSAAGSGDRVLEARALMTLAGALIHTLEGRAHESYGLLARAMHLAADLQDPLLTADVEREMGFIALLYARYGAAEAAFTRSIRQATEGGDTARIAQARTFRGLCASDRADYERAEADLEASMKDLDAEEHRGFRGFVRATLARLMIRTGRIAQARGAAGVAVDELETGGMRGTIPWGLIHLAEAALLEGDAHTSYELLQRSLALSLEIRDPCYESLSLRGLALLAQHQGRRAEGRRLLEDALACAQRASDVYHWAQALILTELVEVEKGTVVEHVRDAARLAFAAPMADLADRLRPYLGKLGKEQTRLQTPAR